jgi:hypothetical protein
MNCKDCKHWGAPSNWTLHWHPDRGGYRDCEHPSRKAAGSGYHDFGSDLTCAPDFGCVQFDKPGAA